MRLVDAKHNLYKTLSRNGLDKAIPIVETFFMDHVLAYSYENAITELEFSRRVSFGVEAKFRKLDEERLVLAVVHALKERVHIRRDGLKTVGTIYVLNLA